MKDFDLLKQDPRVQRMRRFTQHGDYSTYDHCERVACLCRKINRRFCLGANEKDLMAGAMLHDYFLYDWHENPRVRMEEGRRLHGYCHADIALRNATDEFELSDNVAHIIWCHMWPLNLTRIPRSREAWIVCAADKWCSIAETLRR